MEIIYLMRKKYNSMTFRSIIRVTYFEEMSLINAFIAISTSYIASSNQ